MRTLFLLFMVLLLNTGSVFSQSKLAFKFLTTQPQLEHSFVGIYIYNPAKHKVLYQHNGHRYFTPASNTKLYSFYTGLTYLGDSTTGIQYQIQNDTLYIRGTGDPSFLHPDFKTQPVYDFLKQYLLPIAVVKTKDENKLYGPGWAWDDYNGEYQPERDAFPIYGNVAWFSMKENHLQVMPSYFSKQEKLIRDTSIHPYSFEVKRERLNNLFHYNISRSDTHRVQQVPFITFNGNNIVSLLQDTLHKAVYHSNTPLPESDWKTIHNEPVDSLFRHMMYRSDNFYAEQTDQMVSMKLFHEINTEKVIDYMLDHELSDLPDKPVWVDGSGLSRYNLFTPADMVTVLNKLYNSFPHSRIYSMLPTGGKGTLKYLYHDMAGYIYAKTGSLSNNVTLSGYLITRKKHTLIFSIMINHSTSPLNIGRKSMESFLRAVWEKY